MTRTSGIRIISVALLLLLLVSASTYAGAEQWTQPTPEELHMTSQPEVPGAAAVYLYREERTDDKLHVFNLYTRLKVLTEGGKKYGNVELSFAQSEGGGYTVNDVAGRTIHPDGTVIPFTGKPYDKLVEKTQGVKYMAKVFSLPDVQIGSIIEYRYTLRYDDNHFIAPQWYIQSNLFTRKAHYIWRPTGETLVSNDDRGELTNGIAWTSILPQDAVVNRTQPPSARAGQPGQVTLEVNVHDILPAPDEEYMPPVNSFTYRVLFYYSPYQTAAEYWKNEGKHWSKTKDKFIGPGAGVGEAVRQLIQPVDTQDQKLRKIYSAVMQLENTDFTREHSASEEKSLGLGKLQTTDDILARKRGSSDQLAELFVAMARAAGMKAYVMAVTNRDHNVFSAKYFSLSQLDDLIAIVNVDGKEKFFDPGSRYCPYQHLAWKHTVAGGIRQTDSATELTGTPFEPYTFSRIQRIANLTMDEQGIVTGTIKMVYAGSPALHWRHSALTGDSTSLNGELKSSVESLLPQNMDVSLLAVEKLDDYEQPLTVNFSVKGPIATMAGKRIMVTGDIFQFNSKATFPNDKRETGVYFEYTQMVQDAVRIKFPASFALESLPTPARYKFQASVAYGLQTESTPTSITFRRDFALGDVIFKYVDYPALRSFYAQFETKDQEPVVLKSIPVAASSGN
jgi:hypothetical protein